MTTRQQNNKTTGEKIKSFFQGENWKKSLVFFFFILIAFGFWLLQYLQQKFEIELVIPLKYENLPPEVVLRDNLPQTIQLKISDKGTVLLNYSFSKKFDPIEINLKNIDLKETNYIVSESSLGKEIHKRLLPTTILQWYAPGELIVGYRPLKKKEVPVLLNGEVISATGYMLVDSIHIDPPVIDIFGSEETLDTLQAVYTEKIILKDVNKPLDKKLNLIIPRGVTTKQKEVLLSGDIEGYTEKSFTLPIVCENLPDDYIIRLFPSTVEVSCQLVLSKYTSLVESDFTVSVNYHDLILDKKYIAPLTVSKKPDWLTHYRISPENVEFLIEKKQKQ